MTTKANALDHVIMQEPSRRQLETWDRTLVWHAFTQMAEYEPLIIERAECCVLVDVDGNEYLDAVSSLWCNVHGHRHPRLDAAVRQQLDRVAHVTSLGASNPTTIQLARRSFLKRVAPMILRSGLCHWKTLVRRIVGVAKQPED